MLELPNLLSEKKLNKEFIKNCWICEKWQLQKYQIDSADLSDPVFLHLEFNNYRPFVMMKNDDK